MDSNQIDLLLELVPLPVMIRFFHRRKTAIAFNIHKPLTFLNQLQDHDLITEDLYQSVLKPSSKDVKQQGLRNILTYVEKQGEQSIERFWKCVFEDHMLKEYPFLNSFFRSLLQEPVRVHGQLPHAKKITGSEENEAGQKKIQNKRKKSIDETVEEPHTSSVSGSSQRKAAMTTRFSGSYSMNISTVKEGKPSEIKKGEIKTEKPIDMTEDEKPSPSFVTSFVQDKRSMQNTISLPIKREQKEDIWTLDKTFPVTCVDEEGTHYPDKHARALVMKREEKDDISTLDKTFPVTCGNKEGTLHADKLARGEKCILCQDHWFTPNDFERFSGRGNCKNWKRTIRSQNTPLETLLQEGHLQCQCTYRRYGQKKKAFSSSCVESSSPETNESSEVHVEWIEEEDNEKEGDNENDSDPVDSSTFDNFALPVSCGSVSGLLYKSRFTGSRCKSIRTEERWFSPEEFVKQDLTLTEGHWRKDILCHGKTLNYLVKKKILRIHSWLCPCDLCSPEKQWEQDNDDVCYICNTSGKLVCCDGCARAFHHHCHLPTLQEHTLKGKWLCTFCVLKANHELWTHVSLKSALQCPVSGNIMRCEYLLLHLYKEDAHHVFTDDPTKKVAKYRRVISNPMWLNRVKSKLQNKEYETMRQFMHDVLLIFKNCKTFNKDNEFGKMGDRLSKLFVQHLYTIFKIK